MRYTLHAHGDAAAHATLTYEEVVPAVVALTGRDAGTVRALLGRRYFTAKGSRPERGVYIGGNRRKGVVVREVLEPTVERRLDPVSDTLLSTEG